MGPTLQAAWEVTPLMVGGSQFFTAGTGRTVVVAMQPRANSVDLSRHDTAGRGAVRANNRGVSY
jgi:hypothetical protein